jgi:hypothetical protein
MSVPKYARTAGWLLLAIIIFWAWYMVAADYGYKAVSGTYTLRNNGETSILVLRRDRSFQQELVHAGKTERAQGTWRRFGEGGIAFSRGFLRADGQEAGSDVEVYGRVEKKALGLLPSIVFDPEPGGPIFQKDLFRR